MTCERILPTVAEASAALSVGTRTLHRRLERAGVMERIRGGRLTSEAADALGLPDIHADGNPYRMTPLDTASPLEALTVDTDDAPEIEVPVTLLPPVKRSRTGETLNALGRFLRRVGQILYGLLICSLWALLILSYGVLWLFLPVSVVNWLFAGSVKGKR